MNKSAIKTFSTWARRKLREDIKTQAALIGITEQKICEPLPMSNSEIQYYDIGTATPTQVTGRGISGRRRLAENLALEARQIGYQRAYNNMIESTASCWFNRLIALRYMELNGAFSDPLRVLSSAEAGRREPDLLQTPFESSLTFTEEEKRDIIHWKMNTEEDTLFRFLLFRRCNQLHEFLPGIFEEKDDPSEMLILPSFINRNGVVYHLVHDIDETDWNDQVQIIGWFYQYYNAELKDETFAKKSKISKEEIPAVTQLFTPDWIVRYMVENSLGRLWLEGHSYTAGDFLPEHDENGAVIVKEDEQRWYYYLEEAEQEPEVQEKLEGIREKYEDLLPEDLTFMDCCMGSGHILVYAFDVLMQIYQSQGYLPEDAAQSILQHNLYGLDIDDRAYQLAYFAVMMKALKYDSGILERGITPHLFSIQESNSIDRFQLKFFGLSMSELERNNALNQVTGLLDTFRDAKEYGSILTVDACDWELLERFANDSNAGDQIAFESVGLEDTKARLLKMIAQGKCLASQYFVTCTNPPYMAVSSGSTKLNNYVKKHYPDSKADLFAIFIERCLQFTQQRGFTAMITMHGWMFLSSFEKLRIKLQNIDTINMAHLGAHAFEEIGGEVVQTTSFVARISHLKEYVGTYCRLVDSTSQRGKEHLFLSHESVFESMQKSYVNIPGAPIAYWVKPEIISLFSDDRIGKYYLSRVGLMTTDNSLFLRCFWEVSKENICFTAENDNEAHDSHKKWFPHNKGGAFRKWFGNQEYVVDWEDNGRRIKQSAIEKYPYLNGNPNFVVHDDGNYFKENISWSEIAMGNLAFRYFGKGFTFNVKGMSAFPKSHYSLYIALAFCNSCVASYLAHVINPSISFGSNSFSALPFLIEKYDVPTTEKLSNQCVELSKADWDSFETSWNFKQHPLIEARNKDSFLDTQLEEPRMCCANLLSESFEKWKSQCEQRFRQLKENEVELNRIFIDIYGLQDELSPEVEDKDVTVRKANLQREIKSLISYAVGCMFGRYSLDVDGLAYAGGNWDDIFRRNALSDENGDKILFGSTAIAVDNSYQISTPDGWKDCTFSPDPDNILPITDSLRFEDDIVNRFVDFIRTAYGEDSLQENLRFIADALGNKGSTPEDTVRLYFLNDFFKDHCNTYSATGSGKRPIYWLFDSGKQNGFKALVYMHRWNAETITRVRSLYLHPIEEKYENEVRTLGSMIQSSGNNRQKALWEKQLEKLRKQIAEVKEYDEKIEHLSEEKIDIDLDVGVKKNYEKVQTDRNGKKFRILAEIK